MGERQYYGHRIFRPGRGVWNAGAVGRRQCPGGRYGGVSWSDSAGNLWMFGGWGCESDATGGYPESCYYNDVWEFSPSIGAWTWMGGSSLDDQPGSYGEKGAAATGNIPGARENAASWTDKNGDFWLFGGYGYDSAGTLCYLNDLWHFQPARGTWVWVSGSSTIAYTSGQSGVCKTGGQAGVYGRQGASAQGNTPGGRDNAVSWTDGQGNLWLFGGYGSDATGVTASLDDLWKFDPSNSEWTWIGGSNVVSAQVGQPGSYGAWIEPSASSYPGSRQSATGWTDANGNFWLFGGLGYDVNGTSGYLNDLWQYNPTTGLWAWMGRE